MKKVQKYGLMAVAGAALLALGVHALAQGGPDALAPTGKWSAPERGAAMTPPMGWNSWNAFHTDVDEEKVLGAAQVLVDTGLSKLGYVYINIDDGWWLKRRQSDGRLQVRTAIFPSAAVGGPEETSFKPFVDKIHSMGLKAGIYSDIGRNSCSQAHGGPNAPNLPEGTVAEREVGLHGYVRQDIQLFFEEWGFDFIKVDACGIADYGPWRGNVQDGQFRAFDPIMHRDDPARDEVGPIRNMYQEVADAMRDFNPDGDYFLSLCTWGKAHVRQWGKEVGNSWRTSDDITPRWGRMLSSYDTSVTRPLYAQPGAWNDPDMLYIGAGDFDANHMLEAHSHFNLWAMLNAPLLIGFDMRKATPEQIAMLGNADVVALHQDKGGHQAVLVYRSDDVHILAKTLSDGTKAVLVFNRGVETYDVALTAAHLKYDDKQPVTLRDLWSKETLPAFTGETVLTLKPRETRVFVANGTRTLPNGMYLSELPGSINVAEDGIPFPEPDPEIHRAANWGSTRSSGDWPNYGGWGGAQADASPYSTGLVVGSQRFRHGLGILSRSRMEVKAQGQYKTFAATVGVDNATRNRTAKVRFRVYGDGKLLSESPALGFNAKPHSFDVNIANVKIVELVVIQDGNDSNPVATAWGDARFVR